MPTKMYLCNECDKCSIHKPESSTWGHECWAYTVDGDRVLVCRSHIEEIPLIDSLMLDAAGEKVTR